MFARRRLSVRRSLAVLAARVSRKARVREAEREDCDPGAPAPAAKHAPPSRPGPRIARLAHAKLARRAGPASTRPVARCSSSRGSTSPIASRSRPSTERGGFSANDLDRAAHVLRDPRPATSTRSIRACSTSSTASRCTSQRPRSASSRAIERRRTAATRTTARAARWTSSFPARATRRSRSSRASRASSASASTRERLRPRRRARALVLLGRHSGPGKRNRTRGILADLAAKSDARALARGEHAFRRSSSRRDVDAALASARTAPTRAPDRDDRGRRRRRRIALITCGAFGGVDVSVDPDVARLVREERLVEAAELASSRGDARHGEHALRAGVRVQARRRARPPRRGLGARAAARARGQKHPTTRRGAPCRSSSPTRRQAERVAFHLERRGDHGWAASHPRRRLGEEGRRCARVRTRRRSDQGRGAARGRAGDVIGACRVLEAQVRREPGNGSLLVALGGLLHRYGKTDAAVRALQKVRRRGARAARRADDPRSPRSTGSGLAQARVEAEAGASRARRAARVRSRDPRWRSPSARGSSVATRSSARSRPRRTHASSNASTACAARRSR